MTKSGILIEEFTPDDFKNIGTVRNFTPAILNKNIDVTRTSQYFVNKSTNTCCENIIKPIHISKEVVIIPKINNCSDRLENISLHSKEILNYFSTVPHRTADVNKSMYYTKEEEKTLQIRQNEKLSDETISNDSDIDIDPTTFDSAHDRCELKCTTAKIESTQSHLLRTNFDITCREEFINLLNSEIKKQDCKEISVLTDNNENSENTNRSCKRKLLINNHQSDLQDECISTCRRYIMCFITYVFY